MDSTSGFNMCIGVALLSGCSWGVHSPRFITSWTVLIRSPSPSVSESSDVIGCTASCLLTFNASIASSLDPSGWTTGAADCRSLYTTAITSVMRANPPDTTPPTIAPVPTVLLLLQLLAVTPPVQHCGAAQEHSQGNGPVLLTSEEFTVHVAMADACGDCDST